MKTKIPNVFAPFLWSYNLENMDLENDKRRIITNVLNWGTKRATSFLFKVYKKNDIKKVVASPMSGEWSKKSLNFWALIFNLSTPNQKRVLK